MMDRRRSPRYPVRSVSAALLATVDGRVRSVRPDGFVIETARQVRLDRACTLLIRTPSGKTTRCRGHISSCRLGEVRTLASGRTQPVYEADVLVAEGSTACLASDSEAPESVTIEFSYDAQVRNMSPYGALIETELPLMVGSSSTMSVRSPQTTVQVSLCVVFSREIADATGNRLHQLGVEFTGVDQAQREVIEKLVFGALDPPPNV